MKVLLSLAAIALVVLTLVFMPTTNHLKARWLPGGTSETWLKVDTRYATGRRIRLEVNTFGFPTFTVRKPCTDYWSARENREEVRTAIPGLSYTYIQHCDERKSTEESREFSWQWKVWWFWYFGLDLPPVF